MLQQTQVARVVDRWPRFLDRFPSAAVCSSQPVGHVIDEWSGLGYNMRAVNLHRAAVVICDSHGGTVPADLDELLALPGIGPYTARAIRAFAFEMDDGVVDTNIGRVLARVSGRSLKPAEAQRMADGLVPSGLGWEWNQAIMEHGALVCRPDPDCGRCAIRRSCTWRGQGADPAVGSASVSKSQPRFEGSDRQGRGRLLEALRAGSVTPSALPAVMGWPGDTERAHRVAATLVADGLAAYRHKRWHLP